jgi:hypothetical protein
MLESESSGKLLWIVPLKYINALLLAITNIDCYSQQLIQHLPWLLVLRLILHINVIVIVRGGEVLSVPIINEFLLAINNSLGVLSLIFIIYCFILLLVLAVLNNKLILI